jgi:alpha/beta superfamily hydrolase
VQKVTPRDNFFDLGGHSLLSIQMIAQIEKETGNRLSPRNILLNTLRQIAAQMKFSTSTHSSVILQDSSNVVVPESEPFYFHVGMDQLFGILQRSKNTDNKNTGVLFCAPIAQEYMRSYWIFRQIAAALCASGFHVLRFDYTGCGDSSGANLEGGVAKWALDARMAEQELLVRSGVQRTITLAARFGALIAAKANLRGPLVLWDPVENGAAYLKELELLTKAKHLKAASSKRRSSSNELVGFDFPLKLREEISKVDLVHLQGDLNHRPEIVQSSKHAKAIPWNDVNYWGSAVLSGEVVKAIVKTIQDLAHTEGDMK